MNLSAYTPNTIYGWIGLGLIGGALLYHKSLTSMGLVIGLGLGIYLYFVVDQGTTATSS